MELFDLEIPIRATGVGAVKKDMADLERQGTRTAATMERGQQRTESASLRATRAIMQQEAQQRANAQAALQASRAIETGMARIYSDVTRASAAFKAGTISARDYKTALQFARQEAQALGGTAANLSGVPLRNFNAIMAGTTVTAKGMGTGLATVRTGLASMAAMAIGASGALGSVGASMLTFATGTGMALAVVAGIAAIALAFKALTARSREQKRVTDELRDAFKKLNDEMNRGPQAQRAAEQKAAADLRRRVNDLQSRLTAAESERGSPDPEEQQARRAVIQRLNADLAKARQELSASEAALGTFDATQSVEDANKRREALISLVAAGQATAEQERELRAELAKTRAELAQAPDAYDRTTAGIARRAELTERAESIEAAFRREVKETTATVEDRTGALIALLTLEEPTAERWAELRARADTLTSALAAGNLPLERRVELLRELAAIEAATGFGGDLPTDPVAPRRTPLRTIDAPQVEAPDTGPDFSGFEGDSLGARMRRQLVEAGVEVQAAAADVQAQFAEAGQSLGMAFEAGVVGAFAAIGSGGNFGQVLAGFMGDMLAAIGSMAIKFGIAAMGIGALMEKIMASLASLNPIVAIAAGAALVALGAALKGAASDSFGGGRVGRGGSAAAPGPQVFNIPVQGSAPAKASALTGPAPTSTMEQNTYVLFGNPADPAFAKFLGRGVEAAVSRNLVPSLVVR